MLRGNKGPIIQVDRLIFDTRNKTKKDMSTSLNKTNKDESYIFIPSNKIKIFRLTHEDSNKDDSIDQQPLPIPQKTIKQKDEDILSPVYESIDGRRDSIDLIKK